MPEDEDSRDADGDEGGTEAAPDSPPPPPPPEGFDLPPSAGLPPPPPPPIGFENEENSKSEEQVSESIDHEAAKAMLLKLGGMDGTDDLSEKRDEDSDGPMMETALEEEINELEVDEGPEEPSENLLDLPEKEPSQEVDLADVEELDSVIEEGDGNDSAHVLQPPPPAGFDAPPPPPAGFDASAPSVDLEAEFPSDLGDPINIDNEADALSSIDSLADTLSLLEEEWQSEAREEIPDIQQDVEFPPSSEHLQSVVEDQLAGESSEVKQAIDAFGLVKESEFSQPDSIKSTRQSPFLRTSSEVDSIPGDKLHATLSETEKVVLNPDGSIRKQFIDGELILRNSSKKHRAWDIEVHLDSIDSTDFGEKLSSIKELDPTEETAIPYTASGPRMLMMKETIDTERSRAEEPSLSLVFSDSPQDVEITIEIENVSPVPLLDVEVKRTIPDSFILPEDSLYSVEKDSVVWDIGRMNIGEIRTLSISAKVQTDSVGKIKAGKTTATYSADATVSRARFDRVHGSGRQFSYVNAIEDDRPGVWHCTCVFENKSSFVVSLSGATVRLVGRGEPILDVSDIRQDVPPEGKWDSMVKRVESEDQPSFTQEIRFSILPRVSVNSSGIVELKEQSLTVLDAVLQKRFDKSRIKSYVSSKVDVTVTLENTGTSEINVLRILDDIPGIFETPSTEDVSIELEGTELKADQYRIDVVSGVQIEEKHLSPDGAGNGLRITVGTSAPLGLNPGKTVLIRYPLSAPDPSPMNKMLVAPIKADFSSERFGPVATRLVERPPMIKVVHKRRNISTGKEVFPGGKPGQYEIMLMFHNSSDSALDDLALHDIVPGTFTIEDSTIRSDKEGKREASTTKESARDGTQVTWAIGRIEKSERIEVLYTIQGDPEAEYKVSDAQDFHGATFGNEVDEEPNIPEWMESTKDPLPPPSEDLIEVEEAESDGDPDEVGESELENADSNDETSDYNNEEDEESSNIVQNPCPACGNDVGKGSSICVVCGADVNSIS